MSSARKRATIQKANAETERLKQKLAVAETMGNVWKAAAEYAARTADDRQARIDALMLEFCPDEMTEAQRDNWAKHQQPVSDDMQQEIDTALVGSNVELTGAARLYRAASSDRRERG